MTCWVFPPQRMDEEAAWPLHGLQKHHVQSIHGVLRPVRSYLRDKRRERLPSLMQLARPPHLVTPQRLDCFFGASPLPQSSSLLLCVWWGGEGIIVN